MRRLVLFVLGLQAVVVLASANANHAIRKSNGNNHEKSKKEIVTDDDERPGRGQANKKEIRDVEADDDRPSGHGSDNKKRKSKEKSKKKKASKKKKKRERATDDDGDEAAAEEDDETESVGDVDKAGEKRQNAKKARKWAGDDDQAAGDASDGKPRFVKGAKDDDDDVLSDVSKKKAAKVKVLLDKAPEVLTGFQKYQKHIADWKGQIQANEQHFSPMIAADGATESMNRQFTDSQGAKVTVSKLSIAERIPGLKIIARKKMSLEEELILDASLSFIHGLRQGVFSTLDASLDAAQVNALENWLLLLRISLPQQWALHDLIDDLLGNLDFVSQGAVNLEGILHKHSLPRINWSTSCQPLTGTGDPFHCGFWKLLHVMSVGMAEHRGGTSLVANEKKTTKQAPISPGEAADIVQAYVSHFFQCTECKALFLERYDDCSYKRCERLVDEVEGASDSEWKELATYLWEFHNEITIRILREQTYHAYTTRRRSMSATAGLATTEDEAKAIWPSVDSCYACYQDDGAFNKNAIFLHLESVYWPAPDLYTETSRFLMYEVEGSKRYKLTLLFLSGAILWILFMHPSIQNIPLLGGLVIGARRLLPDRGDASQKRSD